MTALSYTKIVKAKKDNLKHNKNYNTQNDDI